MLRKQSLLLFNAGVLALNQIQALLTKSAAEPSPSQSTNHGRFPTTPTLVPRPSPSALHNKSSRTVPAPARVVGSVELAGELGEPQLAFSVIQAAHRGIVSTLANVSTAVPLGINPGAAAFDGLRVNPVMYPSTIGGLHLMIVFQHLLLLIKQNMWRHLMPNTSSNQSSSINYILLLLLAVNMQHAHTAIKG